MSRCKVAICIAEANIDHWKKTTNATNAAAAGGQRGGGHHMSTRDTRTKQA